MKRESQIAIQPVLPIAAMVLVAFALSASTAWAQPDSAFDRTFQEFLAEECKIHPTFASSLGNHEHDHELDDLSPAARAKDVERYRKWLERLSRELKLSAMPRDAQIDAEIWMHSLKYRIWQATETDDFANDPRVYLTYVSDSVFGLLTQSTLPKHRNIENAARRIGQIPRVIAAAKESLKNPPKILTEIAIQRTQGAIDFYREGIFVLADESRQLSLLREPCEKAVASLTEFKEFLQSDVLPRSTGTWRLGKEKFYAKLELELDAGLTGDEVIAEARSEANRVEREMYYVAKQLWHELFPDRTVLPDDESGRRDTVREVLNQLGKSHGKPEELVEDARKTVARIQAMIRDKGILTLPDPDQCEIIEMPEFQRGFSAAYLNPAPALDANAKSLYAISPPPSDWPESRRTAFLEEYNQYMLQILTIHEAYPGHYVQLDYSNRSPSLIRKVFSSGVFAEGWAVYTEQMMLDQGYGHGDLALRLHQLKFYLRAVLNAILDHSMHCEEMSDEEAMALLTQRGYQTEGEAFGKVQRAKQSSCQLSTYFVGRTAFYRLRQSVQRHRGEAFDLGAFHEQVLNCGTLPVKYLPELVR
ncbi:MAG: DUF885 domain-containing protein [Planctomycetota bacterium]|jgi:uncharacterized protein (DUF885 family)